MDSLTPAETGITDALVKRVSDRVGTGVPLELALAGEPVTIEAYEEHLREHPDLAALEGVAKRAFLQKIVGILLEAKDRSANIRWLLERLYPEVFGPAPAKEPKEEVKVKQTIVGVPEEELEAAQAECLRQAIEYHERQARGEV